jgi:alpha-mannosidase
MFVHSLHLMPLINVQPYSNVFPHSTLNWVGIDGTQVLCHMTPGTFRRIMRQSSKSD